MVSQLGKTLRTVSRARLDVDVDVDVPCLLETCLDV